jgi:hypothetical protein
MITFNLQSSLNVIPAIAMFGCSILYRTIHGKCSAHSSAFPRHHNHHNALFTMLWHYVEERKMHHGELVSIPFVIYLATSQIGLTAIWVGRFTCAGMNVAKLEIKMIVALVVIRYEDDAV